MDNTKTKFFFKSKKAFDANDKPIMVQDVKVTKDKEGKETTEAMFKDGAPVMVQKVIPAPAPLEVEVPMMTVQDIVTLLQGTPGKDPETGADITVYDEKQIKLMLESLNNTILEQAREQVNAAEDIEALRTNGLDLSKLSWEAIANLPPSQRRGSAIPEEVWTAFEKDYIEVMQHHGKDEKKATAGAKLLVKKFQQVKNNKKVVGALKSNLQLYMINATPENQVEFQGIYENLMSKADTLLEADEEALMQAI